MEVAAIRCPASHQEHRADCDRRHDHGDEDGDDQPHSASIAFGASRLLTPRRLPAGWHIITVVLTRPTRERARLSENSGRLLWARSARLGIDGGNYTKQWIELAAAFGP